MNKILLVEDDRKITIKLISTKVNLQEVELYLVKPFSLQELITSVRAHLKQHIATSTLPYKFFEAILVGKPL